MSVADAPPLLVAPAGQPAPTTTAPPVTALLRRCALVAFLLGCGLALYTGGLSAGRPGGSTALGYYAMFDQGCYLRMARIFAHGQFPAHPADYTYGFGYPLLAAPLLALGVTDPFLPLDVLLFGLTVALTFVLGARIVSNRSPEVRLTVGAASATLLALASPALGLAAVPWNTHLVVPLGLFVLLAVTAPGQLRARVALAVGLALGWVFATRYLDAVFLGLPVLAALAERSRADARRLLTVGALGAGSVLLLVLGSQRYALGGWFTTPYRFHVRADTGINDQSAGQYRLSWIPHHLVSTFLTAREGTRRVAAAPVLQQFPTLALTVVGACFLRRFPAGHRLTWVTAVGASLLGSLFYLSFIAGSGNDLVYGNPRYWAAFYPLWSVLAVWGALHVGERLLAGATTRPRPAG